MSAPHPHPREVPWQVCPQTLGLSGGVQMQQGPSLAPWSLCLAGPKNQEYGLLG